jgi:predicted dehydrogenase
VIRIAVVGYGYWGPNLSRNIAAARECELAAVCDPSVRRLLLARRDHPATHLTTDWQSLLSDPRIDAVAIATPAATHFNLALAALGAGKHVLVEKPLARTSEQALALVDESERRGLVLMVDHPFVFSPAIRAIHELLATGILGELCYYDSVRINLGLVRRDVNVLWDLAVHDLSILDYLLPTPPVGVLATGVASVPGEPEHVAHLTLRFPSAFIAHVHASWLAPVKTRRLLIGGSQGSVGYDDLAPIEKVKIYRHPLEHGSDTGEVVQRRLVEVWSPRLEVREPLRGAVEHFVQCIADGRRPITDGTSGLRVVRLLEAASRALETGERVVVLGTEGVVA